MNAKWILLGLISLVLVTGGGLWVYQVILKLDTETRSGSLRGVSVGDSRSETLIALKSDADASKSRVVVYRPYPPKVSSLPNLAAAEESDIAGAVRLVVLMGGWGVSELTVEFEQGFVSRIHVRRRAFDL